MPAVACACVTCSAEAIGPPFLGAFRHGKHVVDVTVDSHPGKKLKGVVKQRSNISEFTPRNVQSVDERRLQVFGVKILVEDAQGVLNAGMAAEVTIPLE